MSVASDELQRVCQTMRRAPVAAVAVHEDPDSDAVGAAVGMIDLLTQLGARAALYVDPGVSLPLAAELLAGVPIVEGPPPQAAVLFALDCGSRDRLAVSLGDWSGSVVNIDHHHDNTRFGDIDLVDGRASSTSELVCRLAATLGLTFSAAAATALYAGISFDTGHFQHDSTSAATFVCAAALVDAGADPHRVYQLLYETRTLASLRLWARAIAGARPAGAGRALIAVLTPADFAATGAGDGETEGIVDSLRSVAGIEVAALVRPRDGRATRVSLRSEGFDVSAVAALKGGGGHRQAAGFSTDGTVEEVATWLSTELDERLSTASS